MPKMYETVRKITWKLRFRKGPRELWVYDRYDLILYSIGVRLMLQWQKKVIPKGLRISSGHVTKLCTHNQPGVIPNFLFIPPGNVEPTY